MVRQLAAPRAASYAQLNAAQRQALRELILSSTQRLNLYSRGDRLLLIFPPSHPAGALELLIDDRQGHLLVFDVERHLRAVLPLDRLPDALDRAASSRRADFELELAPAEDPHHAGSTEDHAVSEQLSAQLRLSYATAAQRGPARPLLLQLQAELALPLAPQPYAQGLWLVALPLLCCEARGDLLEVLAAQRSRLLRWRLSVADLSQPAAAPAAFETVVQEDAYVQLPLERLAAERPGYREVAKLPATGRSGLQIAPPERLGRLRGEPASGPLVVDNQSAVAVQIYLDGALLGWVAAGQSMSFEGLAAGYYRIFATSPTGSRSWGPLDTYVPGPLTLR